MDNLTEEDVKRIIKEYLRGAGYSQRKIADTPTGGLEIVPRKYVTLNGVSANRPTASVVGQRYFDTSLAAGNGKPIYWNGSGFVDSSGTFV